ncbi:MAG: site-specific DNA-methyltransferase, partial [Prevotellaceae bacterium]|nr:site-specific DNA-methyltransferase [Prevotellaceae bacterium]
MTEQTKTLVGLRATMLDNETVQPNTELLNTLKSAIPQFFDTDGNFKADKFAEELKANNVSEARDGYKLSFVGKDYARLQVGRASETMIVPDCRHNTLPENANSGNVFITGDNLEALRHLQNAYKDKVKMIYIDPPYNTGKEFVYNDKFEFDDEKLQSALGYDENEIARLKSIQGKSSHSAWLTFMYPRLKIAQKLLTDDGVIFISIDDNEQANLKLLMDDVFGEGNFVGQWNWYKSETPPNLSLKIKKNIEYILGYEKSNNSERFTGLKKESKSDDPFTKPQNIVKELCFPIGSINIKSKIGKIKKGIYGTDKFPNELFDDIIVENGKNKNEIRFKNRFIWTQEKLDTEILNDTTINLSENGVLSYKKSNYNPEVPPNFISSEVGSTNEKAGTELISLMSENYFDYPKPVDLIKYLINFRIKDKDII